MTVSAEDVRTALDEVRDPELDQPLTELGFVADVRLDGGSVEVDLQLPTYFCAPNFAWVMVADADRRIAALDGVEQARVTLLDHMAATEITEAVAAGRSFDEAFPGLADGSDLAALRTEFQRKAFVVRQEQVARRLRDGGVARAQLARMTLGELPAGPDADRYRELRRTLGFPSSADAPLLLDAHGRPVDPDEVEAVLARSRLTRVSVEGNADFCQGLLATRADHDTVHGTTTARDLPDPANPFAPIVRPAPHDRAPDLEGATA